MSNQHTQTHGSHDGHGSDAHGSVKSYVIGFVLSIIFTIIPLVAVMNLFFCLYSHRGFGGA